MLPARGRFHGDWANLLYRDRAGHLLVADHLVAHHDFIHRAIGRDHARLYWGDGQAGGSRLTDGRFAARGSVVVDRQYNGGGAALLIGILSDSHGDHAAVRRAVARFDAFGVGHIIHCGDVGGTAVFEELAGRACTFVWGNTDYADDALLAFLAAAGFTLPATPPTIVSWDGRRVAVFHGHERAFSDAASLDVDYVLHGHTHVARDDRTDGKRFINPGALHRARVKTVATLDTTTDVLTFHEIP
ncbi:MAG: metallophosphoesterase family protein, partial [Phycisphaerae bacterium]